MKKIIVPFLILVVIVFVGYYLFKGYQNKPTSSAPVVPAKANTVVIQNFSFNPETLTVKKGTNVTWTNNDSTVHQIKSVTFNSDQLTEGQSFSFTFNSAGSFDYSCAIHPSMQGKIVVE